MVDLKEAARFPRKIGAHPATASSPMMPTCSQLPGAAPSPNPRPHGVLISNTRESSGQEGQSHPTAGRGVLGTGLAHLVLGVRCSEGWSIIGSERTGRKGRPLLHVCGCCRPGSRTHLPGIRWALAFSLGRFKLMAVTLHSGTQKPRGRHSQALAPAPSWEQPQGGARERGPGCWGLLGGTLLPCQCQARPGPWCHLGRSLGEGACSAHNQPTTSSHREHPSEVPSTERPSKLPSAEC